MSSPFDEPSDEVTVTLKGGTGYASPWIVLKGTIEQLTERLKGPEFAELYRAVSATAPDFEQWYATSRNEADAKAANAIRSEPAADRTVGKPEGASTQVPVDIPFGDEVKECKHGVMTKMEAGGHVGFICPLKVAANAAGTKDPEACDSIMVS